MPEFVSCAVIAPDSSDALDDVRVDHFEASSVALGWGSYRLHAKVGAVQNGGCSH